MNYWDLPPRDSWFAEAVGPAGKTAASDSAVSDELLAGRSAAEVASALAAHFGDRVRGVVFWRPFKRDEEHGVQPLRLQVGGFPGDAKIEDASSEILRALLSGLALRGSPPEL